jgi:hypothetical protein
MLQYPLGYLGPTRITWVTKTCLSHLDNLICLTGDRICLTRAYPNLKELGIGHHRSFLHIFLHVDLHHQVTHFS